MVVGQCREKKQVLLGLLRRFRLTELVRRHNPTRMLALFNFINGTLSIGLLAVVAHFTRSSLDGRCVPAARLGVRHQPSSWYCVPPSGHPRRMKSRT